MHSSTLKINLIGNVLNFAFLFGNYLHKKGLKVRVFIEQGCQEFYHPHWEFPELKGNLPEWCEIVNVDLKHIFRFGRNEREFISKLKDCDIIQVFGEAAIWARLTGRPYVFLSYGGDLDILPFLSTSLKRFGYSCLLKNALRRADSVLYTMPQQKKSVTRLCLKNGRFFPYGIPIDVDVYKAAGPKEDRRKKDYICDLLFFHPSRQEWTCKDTNNKGNDKLFKAFARFIKDTGKDAVLVAVEKGNDTGKSKRLILELGIEKYVRWIKPLDKKGVIEMLSIADICFDQFKYGFYGLSTLEALSVGVPTFTYLDKNISAQELPPVVNVFSEDDIYVAMKELASDRGKIEEIGRKSREWAERYYRWDKVIDRYLDLYSEVIDRRRGRE